MFRLESRKSSNKSCHFDKAKDRLNVPQVNGTLRVKLAEAILKDVKEKIGVLYYTKELNSPYFFALSFSVGVYLPFLSPVVFPLLISGLMYLKLRVKGRSNKAKAKQE